MIKHIWMMMTQSVDISFISFISLYLYYKILNLLRKAKLVDKVSVNEVLLELSKVYEIHLGEKRKLSEIPNKVEKLAESLGMDIFPKNCGVKV